MHIETAAIGAGSTQNIVKRHDIMRTDHWTIVAAGSRKGCRGFIWMLKILIPVSFGTALLQASGLLEKIDFLIEPAMAVVNLPGIAALPLLIGLLTGIYGAIATMAHLPLTGGQMTLIAVFLLISHNLVQEGMIQGRSGINPFVATVFRLSTSLLTVLIVMQFVDTGTLQNPAQPVLTMGRTPLMTSLLNWSLTTLSLCGKMFAIICVLMILLEAMKAYHLVSRLQKALNPLLAMFGLTGRVGMLWMTAVIFGLTYGGAVIVEETRENRLSQEELLRLHLSIGINHSVIEDPAVFLSLGLSPFWLWVPRIAASILMVHLFTVIARLADALGVPIMRSSSSSGNCP